MMNLDESLNKIKEEMEANFRCFENMVKLNSKSKYGKVINKLLTCAPEVLDIFEERYSQSSLISMLYLFGVLRHAFSDDGEIYMKRLKLSSGVTVVGQDNYCYRIAMGTNPDGAGLTYQDLDAIIEKHISAFDFGKQHKDILDKNDEELTDAEADVVNEYYRRMLESKAFMKKMYDAQ